MIQFRILPVMSLVLFCGWYQLYSQDLYFPPISGNTWETTPPAELGWCEGNIPPLLDYLEESNTKAFLVLKDGKIVIEHYFGTFTGNDPWYWASAGKSLTAFLVGLAQQEGSLAIDDATIDYLGSGWTSLTPEQEAQITIRNQLTMTTGLDDGVEDADCTDPECLLFLEPVNERWAYHNAPYTLLDSVIYYATGQTINSFLFSRLSATTGIYGTYLPSGYNNVFFSKPRAMARFGLLMLNGGSWGNTPVMTDDNYRTQMISPSQSLNNAYGFLWWLNGSENYMLPGSQIVFPGMLMTDAPEDTYSAMGKNGQILNIVPSQNLIVIRMGDAPTNEAFFVPNLYNNEIWKYLNPVMCGPVSKVSSVNNEGLSLYPNPVKAELNIRTADGAVAESIFIYNTLGLKVATFHDTNKLDLRFLDAGSYFIELLNGQNRYRKLFYKE